MVCMGSGVGAETVFIGQVVDADGKGLGSIGLEMTWNVDLGRRGVQERTLDARTGSDGHFVVCTIPGETLVGVRANIEETWVEGFEVALTMQEITYRLLTIPSKR